MDPARSQEPAEYCWDLTTREARALALALADAKFDRNRLDASCRLSYVAAGSNPMEPELAPVIAFEPILPNGEWTCSPCG